MNPSQARQTMQPVPGALWVSTLYAYGPLHLRRGGVTIAPDQLLPPEYLDSRGQPVPGPTRGEGIYKRSGSLPQGGVWFYQWTISDTP
jgi:hypothetical protein